MGARWLYKGMNSILVDAGSAKEAALLALGWTAERIPERIPESVPEKEPPKEVEEPKMGKRRGKAASLETSDADN